MKLELVKEYNRKGELIYYVNIDDKMEYGSVRLTMPDAIEVYEIIKANYTKARTEVLMVEEI